MPKIKYILCGLIAGSIASISHAESEEQSVALSGNITVVSDYISRGLTNYPENDDTALQATLTASYGNYYASYWGSSLGYSFRELQGGESYGSDKFEHDFIFGYAFDYKGTTLDVWDAFYYYQGGKNTTSNEIGVTVTKPVSEKGSISVALSTYLNDAVYMNQWDTYATVNYTHQINDKLSATIGAAMSYFNDDGKYEGQGFLDTKNDLTYRFATTRLDYAVSDNIGVFGQYYFGGYDRSDVKQKNAPVFGLVFSF
ncbi:hypothetical protein FM020_06285 [Acinetobacter tandoii]|nr:hypothetical protein FM020_06285 [Acinetobacter tandoii]